MKINDLCYRLEFKCDISFMQDKQKKKKVEHRSTCLPLKSNIWWYRLIHARYLSWYQFVWPTNMAEGDVKDFGSVGGDLSFSHILCTFCVLWKDLGCISFPLCTSVWLLINWFIIRLYMLTYKCITIHFNAICMIFVDPIINYYPIIFITHSMDNTYNVTSLNK